MANLLPIELVYLILEYHGYHTWRNGKYIKKLYVNNKKYNDVIHRPFITTSKNNTFEATFIVTNENILCKYNISTSLYSNKLHWFMDKHYIHINNKNIQNQYEYEETIHYVFGDNEKQHLSRIHRYTHIHSTNK
jgi:hypothetical protein